MNKVLVSVFVPKIEKNFDILIPANKLIKDLIKLLLKGIKELCDDDFEHNENMVILNELGYPYDINKNIKESNIKNGSKIILF